MTPNAMCDFKSARDRQNREGLCNGLDPSYPPELKHQVVELVPACAMAGRRASRSPAELAKEFEPTAQKTIQNWIRQADRD